MTTKKETKEARRARLANARAAAADYPATDEPASRKRRLSGITGRRALAAFVLVLLVTVSFVPAYQAGFVWDDKAITDDPMVKSVSGLSRLWSSPGEMKHEGHYWPVTYTTFWLEHRLWGLNPLGYHVVNVLLHLANVLLLWCLLGRLSVPGAWIVAAVFAVHPLHVESVAWIIERKDVLSGLFYLAAFLAYVRFVESRSRGPYLLALVLFVAGLLSKTVVVTLPAALMIWHWWQRGRIAAKDLLRTAPFFAVGLAIAFADMAFYRTREALYFDYSFVERALIAARALWFYVGKLLWPTDLAVIYPLWEIKARDPVGWALVALAAAVPAALWLGRNRWGRGPLACAAFYAATLSPVLGLIDYGYMQFAFVADRYQYLAGIGLLMLIVAALVRAADRLPAVGIVSAKVVLAAVLALLGTLTWRHTANFRDGLTLFSHIVTLNPEARGAHLNLGIALLELGRFKEADGALRRALAINPRDLDANQNLAESMRKQGRYDEAAEQFRRVLQIDGNYALAWAGLGQTQYDSGRYEQAIDAVNRALSLNPDSPQIATFHFLLGRASREAGRLRTAEQSLLRAAELTPDETEALRALATLYLRMGRLDDARAIAARAEQIKPGSPATLHTRAEVLRRQRRYDEAIAAYREALEIDSKSASVHAGLGLALFELQRHEEAIGSLERALTIDPDLPEASSMHRVTGQALQELGRLEAAVTRFERALELEPRDAVALDHLAFIRFNEGRHEEALGLYRALIETEDGNATAHGNMGITLLNLGGYAEAVQSLERSLALDPDQATARAALAEARRRAAAAPPPQR
ncbi:MAG: tetratricopeptide repeat protein [Acidobacteria bacterium]|nr:tetratricopeptide repeat protein [Acidobacteriota bacterium]